MSNSQIIEDLLLEVSVYHPIPDFRNPEHIKTLIYICEQKGYTKLVPLIKETFLGEADAGEEAKKKGLVHLGRGYYGKEKGGEATFQTKDGKLVPIKPTEPSSQPAKPTATAKDEPPADLADLDSSPKEKPQPGPKGAEEKTPEDKEVKQKDDHEIAKEDPEKVLNDPQASMRSKAVARDQHSKNNVAAADAPNKDSDVKGEYKPDPNLEPKVDDKGNVEGTQIPATVKEDPDPKFVNQVATKLDNFYDDVLKEEERAQVVIVDQMKKEGKLPEDFKVVHPMPFGFKHPELKDKPEVQKELADRVKKENKPPHWNLCKVSIPGTNKFCDENIGIPREKMPQLGGKPKSGSEGEAKAKRIADENVRKKMGIANVAPIPPDRQKEYDELYAKENISHVNVEQEFEDYLKSEGISVSEPVEVPAASLKATQSELVGEQVVGMVNSLEEDPNNKFITAPIMVTEDGYVIDGHHRWAAIQAYNMKNSPPNGAKPPIQMKVRIVGEPIETHIPRANSFAERMGIETMSGKAKGGEPETKPEEVNQTLPKADPNAFNSKSDLEKISPEQRNEVSMKIDALNKMVADAKAKGEKAPNYNLCQITIPGTNLYCDDNLGIPREEMPQFKGKPQPGTPAEKMPKDQNGEVDTEPLFRAMLGKNRIKTVETELPSDRLKATQNELVGAKVAGMTAALEKDPNNPGITAPIYVSRDGYVVDGHHRWAAMTSLAMKTGKPTNMKVIVIDMDAKDIIPMANKFAEEQGVAAKKADANKEGETKKPEEKFAVGEKPKPAETPKITDDELGKKAVTQGGKTLYHIGGGYYSDSPNGQAKYIRTESLIDKVTENDNSVWWNLLFEGDIKATVEDGEEGSFREIPKGDRDAATMDSKKAAELSKQEPEKTEPTETETEEGVEIDLDKLAKDAKKRESKLSEKELIKLNKTREAYNKKINSISDKPKGLKTALKNAINGKPLEPSEKKLLADYVRIVEPTSKQPNTFRIYVAKQSGDFSNKINVDFSQTSSDAALIRDVMGSNGVENIATSAFGGKKSTAGQIYSDEKTGKTKVLEQQPEINTNQTTGKIQSIKFGNTTLERLNENEDGISGEEKLRRQRSNRNLDDFGKQISEGKLKFVDTDSGRYPDTAENRAYIIQDSLSKMHNQLLKMAKKAGAKKGSEAMQLLERLKKLSSLNPNENPEAWYKEYNDVFHDIAESKDEPNLGEAWANVAEIWVTIGEMQGKGKGTEQGIIALLPESTTLETVDVIKLGRTTNDANRTIVTIDGISVKKEAGGASAMVPKLKKSSFRNDENAEFKQEIIKFGAGGARNIYGYPNTLADAQNECKRWDKYNDETKDGKKKKEPTISQKNCSIVNAFKNENEYTKHLLTHQTAYQNQMIEQSRKWENDNRLPKGYTNQLLGEMKNQTAEGGMIYNALQKIISINPEYKKLDEKGAKKWEAQMLAKLKNYYLQLYISHAAYNQNVESQDFENDSVYTETDRKTGEGTISIRKSDGIGTLSFMNPAFSVGWNSTGTPSNFAAGRLVPRNKEDEKGKSYGIPVRKGSKPKSSKPSSKKKKKKGLKEILKSLPNPLKEKIANKLKQLKTTK
jgi:hypothetical protein